MDGDVRADHRGGGGGESGEELVAVRAITLAALSNMAVKAGLILALGGAGLRSRALLATAIILVVEWRHGSRCEAISRAHSASTPLPTTHRVSVLLRNSSNSQIEGLTTAEGIEAYLVLLSVCQTCRYPGLDFLDFRRSGETDIQAFAQEQPKRRSTDRISLD